MLSYPLEVYNNKYTVESKKQEYKRLKKELFENLKKWKKYKPLRGIIEDFFKVGKIAFGLNEFHSYTENSVKRNIYLCILLTTLILQTIYKTKSDLQKLLKENIKLYSTKNNKDKNNNIKTKTNNTLRVPSTENQKELQTIPKKVQTTIEKYLNIYDSICL